jgi:hypothetical protein
MILHCKIFSKVKKEKKKNKHGDPALEQPMQNKEY